MLRQITSIPEGAYYRGRFRATTAWSKVIKRKNEGDSAVGDEEGSRNPDGMDRPVLDRTVTAGAEQRSLQVWPTVR